MKTKKHKKAIKYNIYMKQVNGRINNVKGHESLSNKQFTAEIAIRHKVGPTRPPKAPVWFTTGSNDKFEPLVKDVAQIKIRLDEHDKKFERIEERLGNVEGVLQRNNLK